MKEKIKKFTIPTSIIASMLIVTGIFAFFLLSNGDSTSVSDSNSSDLIVVVVGEEESFNSWPGEIISLNNFQVQPDREGTISEWYAHIGERVYAGQVIGRLSRPPQTSEIINMLSEKSQMLAEARSSVGALRTYTAKRILQLQQLPNESKKKLAQAILHGSILKTLPIIMSSQTIIPLSESNLNAHLKLTFGATDSNLRNKFPSILFEALSNLKDTDMMFEKSGLLYFDAAIKLANISFPSEELSESNLESLKEMLIKDQLEFIAMLGEIKNAEIEIDAMIIELEKELAMLEGEVGANEKAYATISGSINGGYSIIATKSGVVSNIMKKTGEFVGPGMPVATITAENNNDILVRMRIPNNIQKPKVGELLSITRPGFGTDAQKARLVGIGNSLDDNGSYMADAVFTEATKWPVGSSVRILAPANSSPALINYSSIVWSGDGTPTVWAVSEADRIFANKITIGRTIGASVEVYTGLKNGDRYITNPTSDIKENMFLPAKSSGNDDVEEYNMEGMEM